MRLFIAEKPSVGKAIAARLGVVKAGSGFVECAAGDVVTWAFGHLYEQAPPEFYGEQYKQWNAAHLPIVPTTWKLLPKSEAKKQLGVIKDLLRKAKSVVNAGDPDDEGDLLVWEILEAQGWKGPTSRLWLSALDDSSMDKALGSIKDAMTTYGMKLAAESRARADWLMGMNLTRAYTLSARRSGSEGVMSVGRVQTPTLALIVRRDLDVEKFVASDYYEVNGTFDTGAQVIPARWRVPTEGTGIDPEGRVVSRAVADAVVARTNGKPGVVLSATSNPAKQAAPLPFSLSALQAAASAKFGMGAQKVLDTCQALYETYKLTTYPRTDCQYLPSSMHADASTVLSAVSSVVPQLKNLAHGANTSLKHAVFNDKKVTAHHAIIPTVNRGDLAKLSTDERKIYELVVKSYIALFYPDHEYVQTALEFEVAGDVFKASGRQSTKPGWKAVFGADTEEDEADAPVPFVATGTKVTCSKSEVEAKQTRPPSRFTEGTVIKAMAGIHAYVTDETVRKRLKESAGIGTEATRAGILETLKKRGYVEPKGKNLISTEKGRALIAALPTILTYPDLTAMFEQKLGDIRDGVSTPDDFLKSIVVALTRLLSDTKSVAVATEIKHACPTCGKALRRMARKDKTAYFWGCSGYADGCKFACPDVKGKPDAKAGKNAR